MLGGTGRINGKETGKEIGIVDVQTHNLVDELIAGRYIKKTGQT
jgi:hypothetical protein